MIRASRKNWTHRPTAIIDRVQRMLDVERPRPAVAIDAIPIEQPKRGIAGLLNFRNQQASPQGVNRSGFDEYAIAHFRRQYMQTPFAVACRDRALQRGSVNPRL